MTIFWGVYRRMMDTPVFYFKSSTMYLEIEQMLLFLEFKPVYYFTEKVAERL